MNYLFDLKYALRQMVIRPAFAATTIFIMTVGLGLCLYNYSFIHSFMLKDLPFENGDRMYSINIVKSGVAYNGGTVSGPDYLEIRNQLENVEKIGAYFYSTVALTGVDSTIRRQAIFTEAGLFDFTQVPALMGRVITHEDTQVGANKVMVIGYDLWQTHFGGKSDILGQQAYVDSAPVEIVGVMPEGFHFPVSNSIWLPMQRDLASVTRKTNLSVEIFVLLKEGADIATINSQLATLMARMENQFPETNSDTTALAQTYRMSMIGNGGHAIMIAMLSAVAFIMLLACTNVGNLLLARANSRAKETAIRVALGAPRKRLIMQMMNESLIICTVSGIFAILIAGWGLEVTRGIMPKMLNGPVPYFWSLELDFHIILVSIVIVFVTALVTGLLPALKISSGDFNHVLRDGTRGALSKRAGKASKALVIFEITLSCCLLTVASALAVGTNIVHQTDYGIDQSDKLIARIELPRVKYPKAEIQRAFFDNLTEELKQQPEILNAALVSSAPGMYTWFAGIKTEGQEIAEHQAYPASNIARMMPGALEMLDVRPLHGRLIEHTDTQGQPFVAVVTESFALKHWQKSEQALGKRFQITEMDDSPWFTIVGVVPHLLFGQPYADVKHRNSVFTSALQETSRDMRILLQGKPGADPMSLAVPLNRVMQKLDADIPAYQMRTYDQILLRNTAGMSFMSDIFNLFALAAIVLAATGIYGVMANVIGQRTQEFGIRRALGVPDGKVMSMLLKTGFLQLLMGAALGAPLAYLMGSQIIGLLGVESSLITLTYIAMPILIGVIVMFATFLPARKAIRLEPSVALRYE